MSGRRDWDSDYDEEPDAPAIGEHKLHRVVGPPGCGKTTYLARQVELAAEKFGAGAVVVASLTRAAAAEVAGRKTPLPRQNIGTLHSHAYQTLNRPKIMESAEGLKAWNEAVPNSFRISNKHAVDPENATAETVGYENEGEELLNAMNVLRQRMTSRDFWPPRVLRFAKRWDEFKNDAQMVDFTDLIEYALSSVDEMPSKPRVFFIDEGQDMSKLEMALALKWGGKAEQMVIVGDPDQNLYQWRGSDPEAFSAGRATTSHVLAQSYRVPAAVHATAVDWIGRIPGRLPVDYHPRLVDANEPERGSVGGVSERAAFHWSEPRNLVAQLQRDLEREIDGRPARIMVLASCAYMLQPIITELRANGVVFGNPYRTTNGAWNPLRGARRLLAFKRPDPSVWGDDARLWTWGELRAWLEVMQSKGVLTRGTKGVLANRTRSDRFDKSGDSDLLVPLENFTRMFDGEANLQAAWSQDLDWWERNLKHADRQRQQYSLTVARKHGAARLREDPRLVLGTIHSVKGGEADIVYVFPDLSSQGYFGGWKKPGAGQDAVYRQFYVAMTRAREELYLCRPSVAEAVKW